MDTNKDGDEGRIDYCSTDGIARITIVRPAKRNALTAAMCDQLHAAWLRFQASAEDRVAVLAAEGDTFCAGADLRAPPPQFWRAMPAVAVNLDKPVIAAVQGAVVGGAVAMVTFCDLCVAAEDARFIYPEARVGVAQGMISAITARIPHKIAMELMLLGEPISARRAYEAGFVNRVVPAAEVLDTALAMAATLAKSAPLVLGLLKRLADRTVPHSPAESACALQAEVQTVLTSADAAEGLAAFRDKRPPRFDGR